MSEKLKELNKKFKKIVKEVEKSDIDFVVNEGVASMTTVYTYKDGKGSSGIKAEAIFKSLCESLNGRGIEVEKILNK